MTNDQSSNVDLDEDIQVREGASGGIGAAVQLRRMMIWRITIFIGVVCTMTTSFESLISLLKGPNQQN